VDVSRGRRKTEQGGQLSALMRFQCQVLFPTRTDFIECMSWETRRRIMLLNLITVWLCNETAQIWAN